MYDYVKRTYAFQPEVGRRVLHTITAKCGTIAREDKSAGYYVQVKFDGQSFRLPCHPDELQYIDAAKTDAAANLGEQQHG